MAIAGQATKQFGDEEGARFGALLCPLVPPVCAAHDRFGGVATRRAVGRGQSSLVVTQPQGSEDVQSFRVVVGGVCLAKRARQEAE